MQIKKDLSKLKDPKKAKILARFFKTKKGQYGEGDKFLGIKVPEQRKIAKKHSGLTLKQLQNLLNSNIHEYRLTAILVLVDQYQKAEKNQKEKIISFYLKNTKNINNWDLVDLSAPKILGNYLFDKKRDILYKLAKSKSLWERRITILSTFAFIKKNDFKDALKISKTLLNDKHDLIHKAVGWTLREIGKKNQKLEENFLKKHYKIMPRTMLRYAIEKFSPEKRQFYLKR